MVLTKYFAILLYLSQWNQEEEKIVKGRGKMRKRTNDAKRKWHWGLGLIHMYSRLMADFISKSHCYAMPVLLQQNEYCILRGSASVCMCIMMIDKEYIFIVLPFQNFWSILIFSKHCYISVSWENGKVIVIFMEKSSFTLYFFAILATFIFPPKPSVWLNNS